MSPKCLPPSLGSIQLTIWKQMWFEDFQDGHSGSHLGYHNRTIFLCCSDASHQVSAQSDLRFGRCLWRFSRWPSWRPSWISELNDFSNLNSPCGPNASHQVWAQSDLGFRSRCGFKIFKMVTWPSWISERNDFSNSESLSCSNASHHVSAQWDMVWKCPLKNLEMAAMVAILDLVTKRFKQF